MKNIELTEDHKVKLLEMCKKLFYQYEKIYLGVNDYNDELNGYVYFTDNTLRDLIEIHWFEFCWKILNKMLSNAETISPVYVQKCILDFGIICFNNSEFQHPVDHLYEIFKQNEKN